MKMKRGAGWALLLVLALGLLAGCQSVNGTDLNRIMLFKLNVQSLEGKETVSVHLSLKPGEDGNGADAEARQMFELFKDVSVDISDFKQESMDIASLKGNFVYSNGTIPFQLTVNKNQITVLAEGMKKPLVIRSDAGLSQERTGASPQLNALLKSMGSEQQELIRKLAAYLIGKLPNPPKISVLPVLETVHNEKLPLTKVEAEIKGSDVIPLIRQFAQNILQDEEGLKQLITDVISGLPLNGEESSPLLENKQFAAEMATGVIRTMLQQVASGKGNVPQTGLLDDNSRLRMVIYADKDNMVRKSEMNFVLAPQPDQNSKEGWQSGPKLQEIRIDASAETWNINRPVKADAIQNAEHSLQIGPQTKTYEVLQAIQPDSGLYSLLKNDLHISRKRILLHLDDSAAETPIDGQPYIKDGSLMVPVRFVAERLEAEVSWDGEKKQVTLFDPPSATTVVLTIGSSIASVNGREASLQTEAQIIDNTTYVPARFVAEMLGAQVGYEDETRMVSISRD